MRVSGKINSVVIILSVVAAIIAGLAIHTISLYDSRMMELERASLETLKGEHLNRLVTAVVMESRGVYGAPTTEKAKPFAKGILTNLEKIDQLFVEWAPLVSAGNKGAFDAVVSRAAEFKAFRVETARLGSEVSPKAADEQGNNDANRNNRRQFQAEIDRLTAASQADLLAIRDEVSNLAHTRMQMMIAIALGGILVGGFAAFWIGQRMIARPLREVAGAFRRLSGGELDVAVPASIAKDEVGDLWSTVGSFRDALAETRMRAAREEQTRETARANRRREMEALTSRFQAEVGGIVQAVSAAATQVLGAAETLSQAASASSDRSNAVASVSVETSSNIQSVASASEELSGSIAEIGRSIGEASRLIGETVGQVRDAEVDVRELSDSASRVGDIVSMIQAIAEQTNLLALNATIESARAGEAGRGFAVVANEVKALAGQTAKATQDIESQMGAIQDATRRTVEKIGDVARRMHTLDQISRSVAVAADQQNAATGEITANIQQAAVAAGNVSSDIDQVRTAAETSGSASRDLVQAARSLTAQSSTLSANVDTFLAGIRVA